MKIKDESEWQQQLADFANDPDPIAETLREFVTTWAEAAEEMVAKRDKSTSPIRALRDTLRATEQSLGRLTVGYLGMALILLSTHWEPAGEPNEFFWSLTPLEQNLYADVAVLKLADLESKAQEV